MQYSYDVQEAVDYGYEEASIIWNLRFWILKNKANNKHLYHGPDSITRTWTYNTTEAFSKIFPFWKPLKIWRILASMEERKIIVKGNFNQNKHDRTIWYAFYDEDKMLASHLVIAHFSNMKNADFNNEKSSFQNRKLEISQEKNGDSENEKSNTDIKPNINTDIKPNINITPKNSLITKNQNEEKILFFETFWKRWKPHKMQKGSKQAAEKSFNKIISDKEDPVSPLELILAADRYCKFCAENNVYTSHISTYLNQKTFVEEVEKIREEFEQEEKLNLEKSEKEEKLKSAENDPFWLKAKDQLINSAIPDEWKNYIKEFAYFGLDEQGKHIISTPSKFIRDWFRREYKVDLDKVFGKWVLMSN